jgi:hypothetical protein
LGAALAAEGVYGKRHGFFPGMKRSFK